MRFSNCYPSDTSSSRTWTFSAFQHALSVNVIAINAMALRVIYTFLLIRGRFYGEGVIAYKACRCPGIDRPLSGSDIESGLAGATTCGLCNSHTLRCMDSTFSIPIAGVSVGHAIAGELCLDLRGSVPPGVARPASGLLWRRCSRGAAAIRHARVPHTKAALR